MSEAATASADGRWYQLRGDDAGRAVVAICDALISDVGAALRERWFRGRSLYEGRLVTDETMRLAGGKWAEDLYNLTRSAVDTAHAEIAARQRPKPMFLTTGADWRTKRKAKKLDKFVEGWLNQRQGARYSDAWELAEDVFRDATIAVGGAIKVVPDVAKKKIRYERVPAYEVLVDPREASRGDPQNKFHPREMDLDIAIRLFTDGIDDADEKKAIENKLRASAGYGVGLASMSTTRWRTTESVLIYEAWRLPFSDDSPGRHVIACRNGVLYEEDWTWPRFPFAEITWSKEPFGLWGTGLAEAGAYQHEMVNDLSRRVHNKFTLNCSRRTFYKAGSVPEEKLRENDAEVFIPFNGDLVPQSQDIPPISDAETMFLETEIRRYFEIGTGVSQMTAAQRKEPGVDAAVAMQTLDDIKSVRFMPKARAYELLFVDIGELTVLAARDIADSGGGFAARWPDKGFLRTIDWRDVDLQDEMYEVRVAPVSSMSKDPAQRLQIIEQLTNMGFLSRERYLDLIGLPDLDSVLNLEGAELQWIERLIDRYLDAEDDDELDKLGGFCEPEGYLMNATAAMATTAQHYFEARMNDAPEYSLDLLRRFMSSLQRMLQPAAPQPMPTPGNPEAPVLPAAPAPPMAA